MMFGQVVTREGKSPVSVLRFSPAVGGKSFLAVGGEDGIIDIYQTRDVPDGNEEKAFLLVQQIIHPDPPSNYVGRRGVQTQATDPPNFQDGTASLDWSSVSS
jgi:hypothetical protein